MGVGHDLEAQRMGGVGDRLHFRIGKMCFQPATLLRENPAGCGNLDDVRARARCLAHLFGAFDHAGAAIAAGEQFVDRFGKTGGVAMTADDRQRGAGGDDARSGYDPIGSAAAQRKGCLLYTSPSPRD